MGLSAAESIVLVVLIPLLGVPSLILFVRLLNALVQCLVKDHVGEHDVPRESLRKRVALVMSSRTGTFWLVFQVLISLLGVMLYVVEMYTQPRGLFIFETGLSVFFAIDYIIFFYIAKDKLKYFFSFFSLVDLLAIYPYFVAWFIVLGASDVLAILLVLRSLRIVRVYRVLSFFSYSNISRQLAVVLLTIFSLIFVAAATMHFIETYHNDSEDNIFHYFHNVLYFIVVALATVGFGDITPTTTAGRMAMMLFIMFAAVLIPIQTIKLINLVSSHSPFMGSYQPDKRTMHMVITGSISFASVIDLIREIFHKYQRYRHCNVVLLSPEEPTEELRTLLFHPYYTTRITYLKGSPLVIEDLQRAKLRDAVACFVLAPKPVQDAQRADTETIMLNLALKNYSPELPTCIQLTKQANKYLAAGTKNTSIVTLDDIKMSILAKSCIVPGFATLVTNLARSYSPEDYSLSTTSWQQEYHYGSAHEIYETELPNFFDGTTFTEAAKVLYAQYHVCLLAVESLVRVEQPTSHRSSRSNSSDDEYSERNAILVDDSQTTVVQRILLNPASEHRISAGCRAFIIALNPQLSKAVQHLESVVTSSLKLEELSRTFSLQPAAQTTPRRSKSSRSPYVFARGQQGWDVSSIGTPLSTLTEADQADESANLSCCDLLASGHDIGSWNEVYHVLPEAVSFQDRALITDRSPIALQGHVVVIGTTEGLEYFLLPLRSKRLPQLLPIVILHPQPPSEESWDIIGRFPEVYFIFGSGLVIADLKRCNMRKAANVVLFTNPSRLSERRHLIDADTLLIYRLISQRFPRVGSSITIAEMTHSTHIKYIEPGLCTLSDNKKASFASVPEQLLLGITNHEELLHSEHHFNPLFAAGQVYTLSMLDSIMSQVLNNSRNNSVLHLISLLACGAESVSQSFESAELALLPLPQAFADQLYGQLFTFLADQDVIPIGLYRCADAKLSTYPFVFTNPPPATLLHKGDCVFVLPPPQAELSLDPESMQYLFSVPEPTRMPSSDVSEGPAPSTTSVSATSTATTITSINSVEPASDSDNGIEVSIEIAPQ